MISQKGGGSNPGFVNKNKPGFTKVIKYKKTLCHPVLPN